MESVTHLRNGIFIATLLDYKDLMERNVHAVQSTFYIRPYLRIKLCMCTHHMYVCMYVCMYSN